MSETGPDNEESGPEGVLDALSQEPENGQPAMDETPGETALSVQQEQQDLIFESEDEAFAELRKKQLIRQTVIFGGSAGITGYIAKVLLDAVQWHAPAIATVILLSGGVALWKLCGRLATTKPFIRADANTPVTWPSMTDAQIYAYVNQRIDDLKELQTLAGWSDVYNDMAVTPTKLPRLLRLWRRARERRKRLQKINSTYRDRDKERDSVTSNEQVEAANKAMEHVEAKIDSYAQSITLMLRNYDAIETSFIAWTAHSDAEPLEEAKRAVLEVMERADNLVKASEELERGSSPAADN